LTRISFPDGQDLLGQQSEAEPNFHSDSLISVFKFDNSDSPYGRLYVSVVYDSAIVDNLTENCLQNEWDLLEEATNQLDLEGHPDVNNPDLEYSKTKCSSSPYPSPAIRKKVLNYTSKMHAKMPLSALRITTRFSSSESLCSPDETPQKMEKLIKGKDAPFETIGSFIGTYEESLFLGRLSTSPSKPFTFICDIGVIANGKCKASLKFPEHIVAEFAAYYYQFPDEDSPTPYVASINIQQAIVSNLITNIVSGTPDKHGYRIPRKGQIQIMIKNQKCVVLKLFLVPYNLSKMPLNAKTFIRQKSYANYKTLGSKSSSESLRYAIHLNIFRLDKNHIYLNSFNVVFSPKPVETDETLRVEYESYLSSSRVQV
jgi:hypothetical protein